MFQNTSTSTLQETEGGIEKLPLEKRPMSIRSAVETIASPDITYAKLQRAVKQGLIPSYTLLNGRKLVRICDILAAIGANGGAE